ncbi:polyprenyl synthetase family protein [Nocardioides sp. NPDC057772]|uniref:polyprenyl synthetase family protein n=1 Tax=Nocardioides sp. NPDC057772 TaxID=3346245 RepID=UPI00366A6ECC
MNETWDADEFRSRVQGALDTFLETQSERLIPLGDEVEPLLRRARESMSGGKRLRAAFCYWGFHAVRPSPSPAEEESLVRAAAALELLQASALVHDDVIDDSDTRRGAPAAHRAFEADHAAAGWPGRSRAYGDAAAVLLGDLLLTWADELLRTSGFGAAETAAALSVFDLTRSEVIAGQFLDITVQARGAADVEAAMKVVRYKAAKYSVERPLHVGAALAGAAREQIEALTAYGLPVGEAFQLRDDLLGVFGDPSVTGKPAGDDLVEGKRTVLVALALTGSTPADADRLDRALGQPLSAEQVADLRTIITTSGAEQQVEKTITELADQGLTALDDARSAGTLDAGAADTLRALATAATQRTV